MIISKALKIAALAAILPALALAQTPAPSPNPQAAIAARQAGFKKMGGAMKALIEQLKSDAPSADVMKAATATIAATARDQPRLFPAGSGPAPGIKTDALPVIWTDRATFDDLMSKMLTETAKLQTVAAGGDVAAIGAQLKATGATCGACHRKFRADT